MQTIYADNDFFLHFDEDSDMLSLKTYNYGESYHDFQSKIFDIPISKLINYEFYLKISFAGTIPQKTELGDINFIRSLFKKHEDSGKIQTGGLRLKVMDKNKEYDFALIPYEESLENFVPVSDELLKKFIAVHKEARKVFPTGHDNQLIDV